MLKAFFLSLVTALLFSMAGCSGPKSQSAGAFAELNSVAGPPPASSAPPSVTVTNEMRPDLLRPVQNLFTLGPGDRLEIEIIGRPGSRAAAAVGPDGKIYYNLLPGM